MRFLKPYLFVLGVILSSTVLFANNNQKLVIKKAEWKKVVKGMDYTENYKELKQPEKQNINLAPLKYDWSSLKFVFYIIVIGLVLFLIIKILSNLNKNPNIKKSEISIESIEEVEEKIHEIDLEVLLKDALKNKKFNIALRINFLIIIKLLSEKKIIVWSKDKTNWEYYSEIKDILLKDRFKSIVFVFEPIWYGEQSLVENDFNLLQPSFEKFINQLMTNE
jgi:hypothetical protein